MNNRHNQPLLVEIAEREFRAKVLESKQPVLSEELLASLEALERHSMRVRFNRKVFQAHASEAAMLPPRGALASHATQGSHHLDTGRALPFSFHCCRLGAVCSIK